MIPNVLLCSFYSCVNTLNLLDSTGIFKNNPVGWFYSPTNICFCPEHVPDWVGEWRNYGS